MAQVDVHREMAFDEPVLIEGLPGLGLVGKIAADHLVEHFGMAHYASCRCEGLPEVAVFDTDHGVEPPVRIHADPDWNLLVLQSDVPVSPSAASQFAACVTGWLAEKEVFPLYVSGIERPEDRQIGEISAVATGDAGDRLENLDVREPRERGVVSGPTGALLYEADRASLDGLGLVVEASKQFPDPTAAKLFLERVVEPVAGIDVGTEALVEQAEEISGAKQRLAAQIQDGGDETSEARPLRMFQ